MRAMLKPVKMKKVKVIAPLKCRNDVCLRLHKLGAVHVNDVSGRITDAEWKHLVTQKVGFENEPLFAEYSRQLDEINNVFSMVNGAKVKGSFFPKASIKIKVKDSSPDEIAERIKGLLDDIGQRVPEIRDELTKCRESEKELTERKNVLEMISGIDSRLDELGGSSYFCNILFKIGSGRFDYIKPKLESVKSIVIEKSDFNNESLVLLTYPKELEGAVSGCLSGADIERVEIPAVSGKPKEEIARIERVIEKLQDEKKSYLEEIRVMKKKYLQDVIALKEEVCIILDRYSLLSKCAGTESSFVLEFFVSASKEKEVIRELKDVTGGRVIIYSVEPLSEDLPHKVPVLLDNPRFLKGFEGLVNMYSVPKYNDFDPTVFIAPAMLFFFGIMLNDVGYGLLLALLGFLFYTAYKKVHVSASNAGIMLVMLGVSSMFFGVVSGGYFGDALRRVFPDLFYLIDPLGDAHITVFGASVENPIIAVLVFSLVVGIVYVNIGYLLGIADCINKMKSVKHKKKKVVRILENQIVGHIGMMVFQVGLFGLLFWWKLGWFSSVPYFAMVMGAVLVLALFMLAKSGGVQTLFGFFDVTGFVGDDLSFIRLLALCLATEGIANIVNMFTVFSLDIPYVGIVAGVFIFVFGHVFNLLVGTLGAGIHSLRLQYVEFFSKFYEGGGVEFEPYSIKRKVTVVEK